MQKEVLHIGVKQIKVGYDFRNDTAEDITSGVAFPIPPYELGMRYSYHQQSFEDFHLAVDDKPVPARIEIRAKLGKQDVTAVLNRFHIDIATFGHLDEKTDRAPDIERLTTAQRKELAHVGLIEWRQFRDAPTHGNWIVEKKYFWTQVFPAHTTVHITHTYTPVVGFGMISQQDLIPAPRQPNDEVQSLCPTTNLLSQLLADTKKGTSGEAYGYMQYVDFILTTANTWQRPIGEFTLYVERPHDGFRKKYAVSFCWPDKLEQVSPNLFKATATDLVPTKELRIGFFGLNH